MEATALPLHAQCRQGAEAFVPQGKRPRTRCGLLRELRHGAGKGRLKPTALFGAQKKNSIHHKMASIHCTNVKSFGTLKPFNYFSPSLNKFMKKHLLVLFLASGMAATAQTSRLSLFEEFTGETCPPCASTNPGLNAILASPTNTPKVVAIKWQVPIPSTPTNTWSLYKTNQAEIDWRYKSTAGGGYGYMSQWTSTTTATSGINAAPTGLFDGKHQWVFGAASDHPAYVTNGVIATAQSYTSAFSVTMNRAWDPTFSSVNLTVNIVATANYSAAAGPSTSPTPSLVFRTVMVERTIHFATQPGTNGEKDFDDVAIKSFPSLQTGMPMAATWTVGQSMTFTLNCPVPSYCRDKAEVAFVGFIQDDVTREVAQAVRADKSPIDNDAKAIAINIPALSCGTSFTPGLVISNNGTTAITAMTITPYIDGVAGTVINWTGTLAGLGTATLSSNAFTTAVSGGHTFSFVINNVSGGDINTTNNSRASTFFLATSYQGTPVVEPFATTVFPPAKWGVVNTDAGASWSRNATANGISLTSGIGATKYDFYNNSNFGDKDELILPPIDLRGVNVPTLNFDVAYAQYSSEDDSLEVYISVDCGNNWQNVYVKSGSSLSTSAPQTGAFLPSSPGQWRAEEVALPGYNVNNVLVKFVVSTDYGNNLYLDNVNLEQTNTNMVGIKTEQHVVSAVNLYPNPANAATSVQIKAQTDVALSIKVLNALGQVVYQQNVQAHSGSNDFALDVKELATGIYNVEVSGEGLHLVKKLTVLK